MGITQYTWIAYVTVCVLIALWNHNRGNSFWIGLLVSAFFTPIAGFLMVGFTRKNAQKLQERRVDSGELKRCFQCDELIRVNAIKCRFCGSDLVDHAIS